MLGQRVQVGEYCAVVKYVGPVTGTEGEWIGVEWEEEGRGKHDGSYKDVRYFTAKLLHGSFVREQKLSAGQSFSDVLKVRYDNVSGVGDEMSIFNRDNSSTSVELVGMSETDQRRAALLSNLVMREEGIVSVGDGDYIAEQCGNSENLDMSLNLMYDVDKVVELIYLMPKLRGVQFKGNMFTKRTVPSVGQHPHGSLERIYLASSGLSWSELCDLLAHFPNIKEVYISGSDLQITKTPDTILRHLTTLDIQNSNISDWSVLSDISGLPNLDTLILSNNSISRVQIAAGQLTKLHSLSLDHNKIGDWVSVAELRKLPALTTLRMRHNPLITGPALDIRLLVIAMLPHVRKLNGTPITNSERLQADIFYLKFFGGDYHLAGEEFHALHPRFQGLVEEYGKPQTEGPKIASIKEQSVMVRFCNSDGKEFEKKLLKSTPIKNVQLIVQRQFKVMPKNQKLFWVDVDEQKIYLDDPSRELSYFNILGDCKVYLEVQ